MKKEGLILGTAAALGIFIMNLISAYGSYGYFSLTNLINTADPLQILSFGAVFAIIFALIRLGLGRTIFKDSMTGSVTGTGKVVSVAVTFLIMYWGFYQTNFSLSGALSGVGVSSNILYIILGIIFLAGMIYLISKMGFGGFLIILGTVVMGITIFTSWIYEKGAAVAIGAVLLLMGLGFWKHSRNAISSNHGLGEGKSKYEVFALGVLILVLGGILGNGIILDVGLGITSIGLIWFFVSRWHHTGSQVGLTGKRRSKYEIFILGILIVVFGAIAGNGLILEIGVGVAVIGLFWWIITRKKVQRFATSPETYKRAGGWAARQTIGRTPFTKGRLMSKRRAEEAAYNEKAMREAQEEAHRENMEREAKKEDIERREFNERVMAKKTNELQAAYDNQRRVYGNTSGPEKRAAYNEIQQIIHAANANGIHLNQRGGAPSSRDLKRAEQAQQRAQEQQQQAIQEKNRFALARKLGIDKLTNQYYDLYRQLQSGIQKAEAMHVQATKLGWTKTKEGREAYKAWYRQYSNNLQIDKQLKELDSRIKHLQDRLNRS